MKQTTHANANSFEPLGTAGRRGARPVQAGSGPSKIIGSSSSAWAALTRVATLIVAAVGVNSVAHAQPTGGASRADAERAVQAYFAMWSSNASISAAAVDRFYAPSVIYYGKRMSRGQVLADKQAYIRSWPVRSYREVPGTLAARCRPDLSLCHVTTEMAWRRVSRDGATSTGRASMGFDFVPAEGQRKIARESARVISGIPD